MANTIHQICSSMSVNIHSQAQNNLSAGLTNGLLQDMLTVAVPGVWVSFLHWYLGSGEGIGGRRKSVGDSWCWHTSGINFDFWEPEQRKHKDRKVYCRSWDYLPQSTLKFTIPSSHRGKVNIYQGLSRQGWAESICLLVLFLMASKLHQI